LDRAGLVKPPTLRSDDRPYDDTPIHTPDLPPTPVRDRNIPATAWIEAPPGLFEAAADLPRNDGKSPRIAYKRRLGSWLLWRAGPAKGSDACYIAVHATNLERISTFRLFPDGSGQGSGPNGANFSRFRTWKQSLLDNSLREKEQY